MRSIRYGSVAKLRTTRNPRPTPPADPRPHHQYPHLTRHITGTVLTMSRRILKDAVKAARKEREGRYVWHDHCQTANTLKGTHS